RAWIRLQKYEFHCAKAKRFLQLCGNGWNIYAAGGVTNGEETGDPSIAQRGCILLLTSKHLSRPAFVGRLVLQRIFRPQ
ncbi:MAG: hypothetical protein RR743_03050, partial [Oscillospiraceae bacterium]